MRRVAAVNTCLAVLDQWLNVAGPAGEADSHQLARPAVAGHVAPHHQAPRVTHPGERRQCCRRRRRHEAGRQLLDADLPSSGIVQPVRSEF